MQSIPGVGKPILTPNPKLMLKAQLGCSSLHFTICTNSINVSKYYLCTYYLFHYNITVCEETKERVISNMRNEATGVYQSN